MTKNKKLDFNTQEIFFKLVSKLLHSFLPAWHLEFLLYYFSLSYDYKIVVTYKHQLPIAASQSFRAALSSLPVQASGFSTALRWPEGGSTRQLKAAGSPMIIQTQGTLTHKDHQLSPYSVQTQFETLAPWDLEAPTGPFIFLILAALGLCCRVWV